MSKLKERITFQEGTYPVRCPVCEGKGIVPFGFYNIAQGTYQQSSTVQSSEPCRSCNGTGIIKV